MPDFESIDQIKNAARGALSRAPDIATAKRRIRALPGPMRGPIPEGAPSPRGMYFDISRDVLVRFNPDGSRDAIFVIATQPDDPNTETVNIHWMPEQETDPPQA